MIKDLIKLSNRLDQLGLTKEADFIDKTILKLAQDNAAGEAPVLITVSAFQMGPSYLINIKGVAATSEILWAKQFMGGEEKLEEAKKYIAEDLKKVYPSVKIDTTGVKPPLTPAMLGL